MILTQYIYIYSFELSRLVEAIQMSKYKGCNLKTTKLLDCALIGAYAVIRSKTVKKNIPELSSNTKCTPP